MDNLTHFIFHTNHFSSNGVKHRAFLPPEKNLRKSVFWRDGLTEEEIWECGRWAEQRRVDNATLKARGDLSLQIVTNTGLIVEPDTKDHPRHANIVGWPEDKGQRVAKAQLLADAATLVLLPD